MSDTRQNGRPQLEKLNSWLNALHLKFWWLMRRRPADLVNDYCWSHWSLVLVLAKFLQKLYKTHIQFAKSHIWNIIKYLLSWTKISYYLQLHISETTLQVVILSQRKDEYSFLNILIHSLILIEKNNWIHIVPCCKIAQKWIFIEKCSCLLE